MSKHSFHLFFTALYLQITLAGCKRCEVPGENLRNAVRAKIDASKKETPKKKRESRQEKEKRLEEEASAGNAIDRLSMLVAVRVGENMGVQFDGARPSESIKLIRGSAYGEDDHPVLTSRGALDMGYFEINNKSREFFCVKLLRKGGDQKFEVPRPSYLSGEREKERKKDREGGIEKEKGRRVELQKGRGNANEEGGREGDWRSRRSIYMTIDRWRDRIRGSVCVCLRGLRVCLYAGSRRCRGWGRGRGRVRGAL